VAILDIHEHIFDLAAIADIVFWPLATDFKVADVEAMPPGHIDIALVNGAVRNSDNEHMARLLRSRSKVLVALGTCAQQGGIPGLANVFSLASLVDRIYHLAPSNANPDRTEPTGLVAVREGELELPILNDRVRALSAVVDVDYFVPGCPPAPGQIWRVLQTLAGGERPPEGSVLGAGDRTQCDECPRQKRQKRLTGFRRIATEQPDPLVCFVQQGFLCLGFATRTGCGTRCQRSGVACRGCYGPPPGVLDQGSKAISALASVVETWTQEETEQVLAQLPDLLRSVHRFNLPTAMIAARKGRR